MRSSESMFIKIWKVIYIPIMYMGIQNIVVIVGSFVYGIILAMSGIMTENNILNPQILAEYSNNYLIKNGIALSLISAVIFFCIFYFCYRKDKKVIEVAEEKIKVKELFISAGMGICLYFIVLILVSFINVMKYVPSYKTIDSVYKSGGLFLQISYLVIIAPIIEEIICRGIVFNRLKRYNVKVWLAIIIQAALFSFLHFNIVQSTYSLIIGIFFGIIYQKTKTLWAPIITHMFYNLVGVILSQIPELNIPIMGVVPIIIFSLLYIIFSIYILNRFDKNIKENLEKV